MLQWPLLVIATVWMVHSPLSCLCAVEDFESDPDLDSDLLSWYFSQLPHHRDKRFIWMSHKKKLILPPGTQLVLTPTLAMPFIRHPPEGLDANLTIATPFTISFDVMGLTDNDHPLGLMPFLNPGIPIGGRRRRRRRSLPEPDVEPHEIAGGERVFLYTAVEDLLSKFGLLGKPCLLRAICEMHESPLIGYGLFGEFMELFLTASKSPYSNRLSDYVHAEMTGREEGNCKKYFKDCPKSIFALEPRDLAIDKDSPPSMSFSANSIM